MGRTARGVRGINLDEGDDVYRSGNPRPRYIYADGFRTRLCKCTPIEEYRVQSRGGKGTINLKTVRKWVMYPAYWQVQGEENIMLISNAGKVIRLKVQEVPVNHRVSQAFKLIEL